MRKNLSKTGHAVVIAGAGPTGLMLAGELALAGVDVAIVERRASISPVHAQADCIHAASRRSISAASQTGFFRRDK
jgi:3-(3-hydroxy-phenyl)propionate hydroxylase